MEESLGGRGGVAGTARRHAIGRTLLLRWRREYREGRRVKANEACPRFTSLAITAPNAPEVRDAPLAPVPTPTPATARLEMAEITLVNGRRLSVAVKIEPEVPGRMVQALDPS